MMLELQQPKFVDIYRTKDRTQIRMTEAHGIFVLTFTDDKAAKAFVDAMSAKLAEPLPEQ